MQYINHLVDLDIVEHVNGISYDTTAVNTGPKNGEVVLLEEKMKLCLINLPCWYHIYEIQLRSVFELKLSLTSAPEVVLFSAFF